MGSRASWQELFPKFSVVFSDLGAGFMTIKERVKATMRAHVRYRSLRVLSLTFKTLSPHLWLTQPQVGGWLCLLLRAWKVDTGGPAGKAVSHCTPPAAVASTSSLPREARPEIVPSRLAPLTPAYPPAPACTASSQEPCRAGWGVCAGSLASASRCNNHPPVNHSDTTGISTFLPREGVWVQTASLFHV